MGESTTLSNHPSTHPAKFVNLAWTALILGIVGVVGSIIPILNNLTAMAAVVGFILGFIATFGTRQGLALIGGALCGLAVVFTVIAQKHTVAELDKTLGGHDPTAMSDVRVLDCTVGRESGTMFTHATIRITNSTDRTQSYIATVSMNDASGSRVSEINAFSNSLAGGQSVILSGPAATGNVTGSVNGPLTCSVARVNRFPS